MVVAAVIADPHRPIDGLDDSKLNPARREALYPQIIASAYAWRIEFVRVEEIDALNILQARLTGMRRALCALDPAATRARIDGNRLPADLPCRAEAVVGGDAQDPAIMAASILAKVARDRAMLELHAQFPQYGFDRHKGYPSPSHLRPCASTAVRTTGAASPRSRSRAVLSQVGRNAPPPAQRVERLFMIRSGGASIPSARPLALRWLGGELAVEQRPACSGPARIRAAIARAVKGRKRSGRPPRASSRRRRARERQRHAFSASAPAQLGHDPLDPGLAHR